MTFWLVMVHHNTTFVYKQLSDLEDIFWTIPDTRIDRQTDEHVDTVIPQHRPEVWWASRLWHSRTPRYLCGYTARVHFRPALHRLSGRERGGRPTARHRLLAVDRFLYSAFSALEQTHCALVACDSGGLSLFFCSAFWISTKEVNSSALWLSHGWCHVKLLSHGLGAFCLHHTAMHCNVTSLHAEPHKLGAYLFSCHLHFWQNDRDLLRDTAIFFIDFWGDFFIDSYRTTWLVMPPRFVSTLIILLDATLTLLEWFRRLRWATCPFCWYCCYRYSYCCLIGCFWKAEKKEKTETRMTSRVLKQGPNT